MAGYRSGQQSLPFSKILIANRGEIAARIIRTCRRLGIKTVAVYSQADASAPFVSMADEAYPLGGLFPAESYLNIDKVLEIALRAGVQAIHPGYGFLSENAAFVQACNEKGLRFIGPSAETMERMKDKALARRLAQEAGVPVAPGSQGEVTAEEALELGEKIGFPLLVKAAAGGGGIGIQRVESREELEKAIKRASILAEKAFGHGSVYLEKFIPEAAHIEVQVLGDLHGNYCHLFERECSVQRRHQKIVEESPSPKLTAERREALCQSAVALARHIGYTSAGTVEFLVDREGSFYFLEMNTRIQVEHPVTEMITGLDLVELQIRIAAGEKLPFTQEEIPREGHAIEGRVYAETPDLFLPSAGTIQELVEPQGEHLRVDSGICPGYEVSTYYDPLLAKVIAWGLTREEAIARLRRALQEYRIVGVAVNIPALLRVLEDRRFVSGDYHTGLLSQLTPPPGLRDGREEELVAAVAAALYLEMDSQGTKRVPSPWKLFGRRQQMMTRLGTEKPW